MSARVRALAPAKVNLTLAVLGRRADGFHELDTWMLALSLCDRVSVEPREEPGIALEVAGPAATGDVRADASNLVWRAASAVLDAAPGHGGRGGAVEQGGWLVRLEKHVPSQSGLGGASSDAAATVLALERALDLDLGRERRAALLAGLGSDCAFFAAEGAGLARCRGRGETVVERAATVPEWALAVWVPAVRCPTADVYRAHAASPRPAHAARERSLGWTAVAGARPQLFNELESAAVEVAPELARWRQLFRDLALDHVRLSGSGSAHFGLFDTSAEAQCALEQVRAAATLGGLELRGSWVLFPRGHGAKIEQS